eukprot:TRINITY_DN6369_c0_g2_i2.p1 TRINITY_DN6369_c0_g2~~TRINITY_DN6369_c0_g2_i2.p1  ORF type:complete len:850 (-),score=46.50 TRINITY_DN6369_c0_g2_i2:37-2586(-)
MGKSVLAEAERGTKQVIITANEDELEPPEGVVANDQDESTERLEESLPPLNSLTNKVGIAMSGGGIRSAAFCSGVLYHMLKDSDTNPTQLFLSCVSGGGYTGGSFVQWLRFRKAAGTITIGDAREEIKEFVKNMKTNASYYVGWTPRSVSKCLPSCFKYPWGFMYGVWQLLQLVGMLGCSLIMTVATYLSIIAMFAHYLGNIIGGWEQRQHLCALGYCILAFVVGFLLHKIIKIGFGSKQCGHPFYAVSYLGLFFAVVVAGIEFGEQVNSNATSSVAAFGLVLRFLAPAVQKGSTKWLMQVFWIPFFISKMINWRLQKRRLIFDWAWTQYDDDHYRCFLWSIFGGFALVPIISLMRHAIFYRFYCYRLKCAFFAPNSHICKDDYTIGPPKCSNDKKESSRSLNTDENGKLSSKSHIVSVSYKGTKIYPTKRYRRNPQNKNAGSSDQEKTPLIKKSNSKQHERWEVSRLIGASAAAFATSLGRQEDNFSSIVPILILGALNLGTWKKTLRAEWILGIAIALWVIAVLLLVVFEKYRWVSPQILSWIFLVVVCSYTIASTIPWLSHWLPLLPPFRSVTQLVHSRYYTKNNENGDVESFPQMLFTDGGHQENLGLLPLLDNKLTKIYIADGSEDPQRLCKDLVEALFLASKLLGCEFCGYQNQDILSEINKMRTDKKKISLKFKVTYLGGSEGEIIYLKPPNLGRNHSKFGNYEKMNYKSKGCCCTCCTHHCCSISKKGCSYRFNESETLCCGGVSSNQNPWISCGGWSWGCGEFPYQSTANIFFHPSLFEAYHDMGKSVLAEAERGTEQVTTPANGDNNMPLEVVSSAPVAVVANNQDEATECLEEQENIK